MTRTIATAALLCAGWASAQCPPTLPDGVKGSQSLRLMTYNAYMLVAPADNTSDFGISHEERAKKIAARIIADDPDVVALQEVDLDDAKFAFVSELYQRYPHYIRKIDENDLDNDSGLMLFSKFPLANPDTVFINHTILGSGEDTCAGINNDSVVSQCNQVIYPQCNGWDCFQNKGLGMVRVINTCNNRSPFNIGFTHTQSKGSNNDDACTFGEDVTDLQSQLSVAKTLFEKSFNPSSLRSQPTFFMGDLNIDGNQRGSNRVTTRNRPWVLTNASPAPPGTPISCGSTSPSGHNEWQLTFDSLANGINQDVNRGFFSCRGNRLTTAPCSHNGTPSSGSFFVDSWASNTSSRDPGQTSSGESGGAGKPTHPDEGKRLDYILHNEPRNDSGARTLCTQWVRRGFRQGAGDELSDHLPVTVDFNFPAPRCTTRPRKAGDPAADPGDSPEPNGPEPVRWDLTDPTKTDVVFDGATESPVVTNLAFPGSMQWYVIDQAVPVEVSVAGNVAFEIFQATDLSTRISTGVECTQKKGEQQVCKLDLTQPPYFVRVFGSKGNNPNVEDRNAFGPYRIRFHRFNCSSKAEACALTPAVAKTATWPSGLLNPGAGTDEMWFEVQTEFAKTGTAPDIDFDTAHGFVEKFDGSGNFVDPISATIVDKKGNTLAGGGAGGFQSQIPAPASPPSPVVTYTKVAGELTRLLRPKPTTMPGGVAWPDKYFVVLKRNPAYVAEKKTTRITFTTSLSYFRPHQLFCKVERTDVGLDDIASSYSFGAVNDPMRMLGHVAGDYETWDNNNHMEQAGHPNPTRSNFPYQLDYSISGDGAGTGEAVRVNMYEDVLDGDNYWMCTPDQGGQCWSVYVEGKPVAARKRSLPDPAIDSEVEQYRYRDEQTSSPDYDYRLKYRVRHVRMECRGSTGVSSSDCGSKNTCSTAVPALSGLAHGARCICTDDSGCKSGETCDTSTGTCQ